MKKYIFRNIKTGNKTLVEENEFENFEKNPLYTLVNEEALKENLREEIKIKIGKSEKFNADDFKLKTKVPKLEKYCKPPEPQVLKKAYEFSKFDPFDFNSFENYYEYCKTALNKDNKVVMHDLFKNYNVPKEKIKKAILNGFKLFPTKFTKFEFTVDGEKKNLKIASDFQTFDLRIQAFWYKKIFGIKLFKENRLLVKFPGKFCNWKVLRCEPTELDMWKKNLRPIVYIDKNLSDIFEKLGCNIFPVSSTYFNEIKTVINLYEKIKKFKKIKEMI